MAEVFSGSYGQDRGPGGSGGHAQHLPRHRHVRRLAGIWPHCCLKVLNDYNFSADGESAFGGSIVKKIVNIDSYYSERQDP